MSRLAAYLHWTPLVAGAALPASAPRLTGLSALLTARDDDRTIITDPDTGRSFVPGATSTGRTIYSAVALSCAIVLAVLLGFRLKTLRNNVFRKRNFTSMLVVALFVFGLGFTICASIVQTGQGVRTNQLCYASIIICLVFYTGNKLIIYIFLLERARVVRAPFMPRLKDYVWLTGMLIICSGFGTITVVGYITPVYELSALDGRCRIGLPPRVSFPLLCFDIVVNFLLTGVFLWLLRPVLDLHGLLEVSTWFGGKAKRSIRRRDVGVETSLGGPASIQTAMNKNIKTLLWKCLIGSTLVMFPTVGNMAQFYIMKSRELGWVCLTICTLDVSWGVLIVNWLTIGSAEAESNLTTLMSQRTIRGETLSPGQPTSRFFNVNTSLQTRNDDGDDELSRQMAMRTRQASATTAEVPVFFKAASLRDEGGLLGSDGVRESWNLETRQLSGWQVGGVEESGRAPALALEEQPGRTVGDGGCGGVKECEMRITINERVVKGRNSGENLEPRFF